MASGKVSSRRAERLLPAQCCQGGGWGWGVLSPGRAVHPCTRTPAFEGGSPWRPSVTSPTLLWGTLAGPSTATPPSRACGGASGWVFISSRASFFKGKSPMVLYK